MKEQIIELLRIISKRDDLIFVFFDGDFSKLQQEIFGRIRLNQKDVKPILILGIEDEKTINNPKWKFLEYFSRNYLYKSLPVNIYKLIQRIQFMQEIKEADLSEHFKFVDLLGLWSYYCHDLSKFINNNFSNNMIKIKKILHEMRLILTYDQEKELNCTPNDIPLGDNLLTEELKNFYNKCCKNKGDKSGSRNFNYRR